MNRSFFMTLLCLASGCASPQSVSSRPEWGAQSSKDASCKRWLERSKAPKTEKKWRLRAARRAYLCLQNKEQNPRPALDTAIALDPKAPHTLDLAERYLSEASSAQRATRMQAIEPWFGKHVLLDSALYLGAAKNAPLSKRSGFWRRVASANPEGSRGRRAMLELAASSSADAQRIVWLRKALKPHRSVLASFGHGDFAGLSRAAKQLAELCAKTGDLACQRWAQKRHAELER
jgi:hypothetical protein